MASTDRPPVLLTAAAALVIGAHFLTFAGAGIWAYFHPDDMMNLYLWWERPFRELALANLLYFSPEYRPMGGLFYRAVFAVFGFNPVAFRACAMLLLASNVFLMYGVARRLANSREVGALTALIAAYHPFFYGLYHSTGTVYDVLCFTFFFSALLWYLRSRQRQGGPRGRDLAIVLGLYVCALDSKEMAASLPLVLAAFELVHSPPVSARPVALLRWLKNEGKVALAAGLVTIPYVAGKFLVSGPLHNHPGYTPEFSAARYLEMSAAAVWDILGEMVRIDRLNLLALWGLLLVVAWRTRSPALRYGWAFLWLTPLPIAFLWPFRGGSSLYIVYFGWALYAAELLKEARLRLERIVERPGNGLRVAWGQILLFLAVALALIPWNSITAPGFELLRRDQQRVRGIVEPIGRRLPSLPRGTRLLFLDDPDRPDLIMTFAIRLYYRDETAVVDRAKRMGMAPDPAEYSSYDYVLRSDGRRIEDVWVKPAGAAAARPLNRAALPASARLVNLSKPGARDFAVGERFKLIFTGAPGDRVVITASHNGTRLPRLVYGLVGPDCAFTVTGVMTEGEIGHWEETWQVGETQTALIGFEVRPSTGAAATR